MRIPLNQIEERNQEILTLLDNQELLTVSEIAMRLGIPVSSARRHIRKMEMSGTLLRTSQGIIKGKGSVEEYLPNKARLRRAEKRAIAAAARSFIGEGDIILLGGGSTVYELAKLLRDARDLHIVTTSVPIAFDLYQNPQLQVEMVGGIIDKNNGVVTSAKALAHLDTIHVNKAFLGADSISIDHGITTPDYFEAEIEKMVVKISSSVFILADHTKFNTVSLTHLADLSEIDTFITDSGTDPELVQKIKAQGTKVVCV